MIRSKDIYLAFTLFACIAVMSTFSGNAHGQFSCATGASDPPFLASGVDPNLLLLIDNSASMYDLAYVNPLGNYCNDDTYDTNDNYAGYFGLDTWYVYIMAGDYFRPIDNGDSTLCGSSSAFSTVYSGIDACIAVNEIGTPKVVNAFAAKGNLLNWLTASKMDVQKQVLTGGKYETDGSYGAPVNSLVMESRGCTNQRFVKEIPLFNSAGNQYWLTFAIRGPEEERFPVWRSETEYSKGDLSVRPDIVTYQGDLYYCVQTHKSSAAQILETGLDPLYWLPYYGTRWNSGSTYVRGDVVQYNGLFYIDEEGGASVSPPTTDTQRWTEYHLTYIEIMPPSVDGFDGGSCQAAVEALTGDPPNLGAASKGIDECLAYADNPSDLETNQNAAFNHSLQTCWSWIKFPDTAGDVGTGEVQRIKNACVQLYDQINPYEILVSDDPGYVCWGWYDADDTDFDNPSEKYGYLGACWAQGSSAKFVCTKTNPQGKCLAGYWEGILTDPDWISDDCVANRLAMYCGDISVPEVVDPSDEVSQTGEFFNLPAVLVDSGLGTQMGRPLKVMEGYIASAQPQGLLHEFADDIRIGAMKFNAKGSFSECTPDSFIDYACNDLVGDQDGSQLVYPIGKDSTDTPTHTDGLVANINDIVADSWTPIAEALFSAVGYFTRGNLTSSTGEHYFRLNDDDWLFMDGTTPKDSDKPCTEWCQNNNILIITEGASTTDLADRVKAFAMANGDVDKTDTGAACDTLYGSTMLDDLTWFAQHGYSDGSNIFGQAGGGSEGNFQNIKTFIVVAGTPRTEGAQECSPLTLLANAAYNGGTFAPFVADDPYELNENLKTVFNLIRAGAAAGSAASVISATRGGEGAIYQAIFWPIVDGPADKPEVAWTGEVHALLIDAYGNLYEDTNGDSALTYDTDNQITDEKVILYYDSASRISKACNGELVKVNNQDTCNGTSKDLNEVKYLWSAAEWLADVLDTTTNRTTYLSSTEKRRHIFTWNDLTNDGVVNTASGVNEIIPFVETVNWDGLSVKADRYPVTLDFGVDSDAEVDRIVRWIRGQDNLSDPTLRPREVPTPANFNLSSAPATITWRLGDVVHSTPTSVSRPAEGYHFLYKDFSYAQFLNAKRNRRNVIYFGANDGMVHAINGGFYDETTKKFWRGMTEDQYRRPTYTSNGPALGAELWAYVPYNLLPHLKCLTQPSYSHKYFVDLKPRVFDVRLWKNEWNSDSGKHPYGWGTIMVIGMRFGGPTVTAKALAEEVGLTGTSDERYFKSAYIIMDITDPESPPTLLAEMTFQDTDANMAYTASVPSVVPMRFGDNDYEWQLVLGSGPTDIPGVSSQNAKIAVVPLTAILNGTAFRIPTSAPTVTSPGSWELSAAANGFVSDSVAVDYQLNENYKGDVVYFGTVEGTWSDGNDETLGDGWGGHMYRLVTYENALGAWENPNNTMMFDAGRPITGAPSIGSDGKNFWVYFGTGRFFDKKDKTDDSSNAQEAFYGLKEPYDVTVVNGKTIKTIDWKATISKDRLLRTDQILVEASRAATSSNLRCSGGSGCLPTPSDSTDAISTFDELEDYVLQETDGWYLNFPDLRERNLGQGALLGGLMTFTTYQPFDDVCKPEGDAFLYGVYYLTGTGYYEPVFTTQEGGGVEGSDPKVVSTRLYIGRGLATTPNLHVGRQEGSKAFVQTSTGTIVEIPQPNLPIKTTKSGRMSWRSE